MTASPRRDSSEDSPAYLAPYLEAIASHGASFEATGWKNRDMQLARFDVMIDMTDFTGRVILDAGSGQGGLAEHLTDRGIEYGRYIGLDAMAAMVEQSRAKRLPEAEFHTSDFAGESDSFERFTRPAGGSGVDLIVFSGSLNTMNEDAAVAVLERAWAAATEGVLFNFLSDRATPKLLAKDPAPAHRFRTIRLLEWALSRTPAVQFRQDYFAGHDGTIAMFHLEPR